MTRFFVDFSGAVGITDEGGAGEGGVAESRI